MDQIINEGRLLQDLSTVEDILIYFLAFLLCVTLPPAAANGPRGLIFGVQMGLAMQLVRLHVYYIYFCQEKINQIHVHRLTCAKGVQSYRYRGQNGFWQKKSEKGVIPSIVPSR